MLSFKSISLMVIFVLIIGMPACAGTSSRPATNEPLTRIRLPMAYIPSIQFAPFYVAMDKGYFREAGLEIDFDYSFETDGVTLTGSNAISAPRRISSVRKSVFPACLAPRISAYGHY
jgi:NitT/TauT family transport system substrate-binding protein